MSSFEEKVLHEFAGLKSQYTVMNQSLDEVKGVVAGLKSQYTVMNQSLDEVKGVVAGLKSQYTVMNQSLDEVKKEMFDLRIKVNTIVPLSRSQERLEESPFGMYPDCNSVQGGREISGYRFPTPW